MRKLIKGIAALAILSLSILLTGEWGEAEAPTLDKAVISTATPTPSPTPTVAPTKAPAVAKATPKPVIVYIKKTPVPAHTATGSVVSNCIIEAFNPNTEADRNRLIAGAKFGTPPCDYAFLFCLSDRTNCSGSVADCYKKYENGEICETLPPEIPFPQ